MILILVVGTVVEMEVTAAVGTSIPNFSLELNKERFETVF